MKRFLCLLVLICGVYVIGWSVGAYPYPVKVKQSDGTELTVRLKGDEWYHWTTTDDGYRIVQNASGIYEYAALSKTGGVIASGRKANDVSLRQSSELNYLKKVGPNLGVTKSVIQMARAAKLSPLKSTSAITGFPSSGTRKLLVILAYFSNTDTTYSHAAFNNLMNQTNYKGTGSFKDYYLENSNGALNIQSTVTKWVELSKTREYYAPESKWPEFVHDALVAADLAEVDFSQFDNDGDGTVESVAVFHTGAGQEVSSNANDIWSHKNELSNFYISDDRTFDNVMVDNYTVQPELYSGTNMSTIGVLAHEFGHALGLPDYYDTDDTANGLQEGTGNWDLMCAGCYNGLNASGDTPSHHNPLSKYELGWITVTTLSAVSSVTVKPIITNHVAYRVNTASSNEYFLLENRTQANFDSRIPGEGMLIYHVDGNYITIHRNSNDINASSHQGLYIKSAYGTLNSVNTPFPGAKNITAFTDATTPSSLSWSGSETSKSITNIVAQANKNITFDFMAIQDGAPLSISTQSNDYQSIDLTWERSSENYPVLVVFNSTNSFGTPVDGQVYSAGQTLSGGGSVLYVGSDVSTFLHSGLNEATYYYYKIWSNRGTSYSEPLNATQKTLAHPITSYPWTETFENSINKWRIYPDGLAYSWTIANGSSEGVPASAYEGTSNALFLAQVSGGGIVQKLISPVCNAVTGEKMRLKFHHAQALWDLDQDLLKVYYKETSSSVWTLLATYDTDITAWTERTLDFTVNGNFEFAFEATGNYGYGVVVDQVIIDKQVTTAVANHSSDEDWVSIFPNPSKDLFNVRLKDTEYVGRYKIVSVSGIVLVDRQFQTSDFSVNMTGYERGIYNLIIERNTDIRVMKIVKQ